VVRVSGPQAFAAADLLVGQAVPDRVATLRWIRDPQDRRQLDQGLILRFPAPASFTGEDVVELQVHGSAAVVRSIERALAALPGLRRAEPGEFTRRALLAGRIDLAQAEGLADLIKAETDRQQQQALRTMSGAIGQLVTEWGADLLHALAWVEASIDFSDEELPHEMLLSVHASLGRVAAGMERELSGSRAAERIREGFEVALVGAPNVGKSTLLNSIARREVALVSEVAGTTRDVLEVHLDLDGLALTLLDMAGLREAGDSVEELGIARARVRGVSADLRIFLVERPEDVGELGVSWQDGDLVALSKADTRPAVAAHAVSGLTGQGVEALLAAVAGTLVERAAGAGCLSHARQREAVTEAHRALVRGLVEAADPVAARPEIVAEEIRSSLRSLDFLLGKLDVEAVLDVVFQSFCIGK